MQISGNSPLLVAVALGLVALPAAAGDFYIQLKEQVSPSQRTELQKAIGAKKIRTVSSLGRDIEIWRSAQNPEVLQRALQADQRVSLHERLNGDYRDLFTNVDATSDLAPDVAKNLAAIRSRPTSGTVRVVRAKSAPITTRMLVNGFDQTDGFSASGTVRLNLLPGVNAIVTKQNIKNYSENNFDWSGVVTRTADESVHPLHTPDGQTQTEKGKAVLSVKNGDIIGRVTIGSDVYIITPLGKGFHVVTKLDQSKFPPDHPPLQDKSEKRGPLLRPSSEAADIRPVSLRNADGSVNDMDPAPVITVGVVFTKGAVGMLGAVSAQAFSDALVNETNSSYANSQVRARLVLAGTMVVDYQESDWEKDLNALIDQQVASAQAVRLWRKSVGANIVVMVVTLDDYCGRSAAILADSQDAYSLVSETCAFDNLSFAHEIGHLQGARHDEVADPTDVPFAYGHGYMYKGHWRTIMAYDSGCNCPRIEYWANPDILKDGVPMGTPARNNDARVLTETARRVADFKP